MSDSWRGSLVTVLGTALTGLVLGAVMGVLWWWITVSGETHRYAAFRVEPTDTPVSLKPRILSYYAQLLADRARP